MIGSDDRVNSASLDSIPVPRSRVLVLGDGTFVVQWEDRQVQALLTGRYYPFDNRTAADPITDFELGQLQQAGIVESFDAELVFLMPMSSVLLHGSSRAYYLNTTLTRGEEAIVRNSLIELGLLDDYSVIVQDTFVIIRGARGTAFGTFEAAEKARERLAAALPEILLNSVVAFIEKLSDPT